MPGMLERAAVGAWNALLDRRKHVDLRADLEIGTRVTDNRRTRVRVLLPQERRPEHVAVLGRTGSGKSSLLKHFALQDIRARRGLVFFDLHGDAIPELLAGVAALEEELGENLSERTILLDPANERSVVGLNLLGSTSELRRFVAIAELVEILKRRWDLEALGARTEELLRNALLLLDAAGLTLIDLPLVLTNRVARARVLEDVTDPGVREYFLARYDSRSDAMQWVYREAVLNKVTVFTADPHFRHVLGQAEPAFGLQDAVERGYWVLVALPRGSLGVEAATFGSLLLARLKDALFARQSRTLFTVYADEFQQLAAYDAGIDELFAESRKFGVSVVAANQFLAQHTPLLQHALLAVGTQAFFRLSGPDAALVAPVLGGGPRLAEVLSNLPARELILKSGTDDPTHVRVPPVAASGRDAGDLLARIERRWARRREDVERDIALRAASLARGGKESLEDWQ